MTNRRRVFWRMAGRRAWICAVVAAVLVGALCLFVKEYPHHARITFKQSSGVKSSLSGTPYAKSSYVVSSSGISVEDSLACAASHRLLSEHIAKGAALSTMAGDFHKLFARSIAEPEGNVNRVLNSFSPDSSILAMRKLCCRSNGNVVELRYFSYDSASAARAFDFFVRSATEGLPKGYTAEVAQDGDVAGVSHSGDVAGVSHGGDVAGFSQGKGILDVKHLPWRTASCVAALMLFVWLLLCGGAWLRARRLHKMQGFRNLKAARKIIDEDYLNNIHHKSSKEKKTQNFSGSREFFVGAVEEVSPFKEKYSNALRWKLQSEDVASSIINILERGQSSYSGSGKNPLKDESKSSSADIESLDGGAESSGAVLNVLAVDERSLHNLRHCGLLSAIVSCSGKVSVMECGKDIDTLSTAYQFPDMEELKAANGENLLMIVHPPLSESHVPEAYLEAGRLNLLVTDAKQGWPPSYQAFTENIPRCKVVVTDMPAGSLKSKASSEGGWGKIKYQPSQRRFRYVVVLCNAYTQKLVEKTCRSLYASVKDSYTADPAEAGKSPKADNKAASGKSPGVENMSFEELMEVSTSMYDYVVRPFRSSSAKILSNLELSEDDADGVIVLRAGCTVDKGFFSDLSDALASGMEGVQCRLKGKTSEGGAGEFRRAGQGPVSQSRRAGQGPVSQFRRAGQGPVSQFRRAGHGPVSQSHRARLGLGAHIAEYGFALTGYALKRTSEIYVDYLKDTYVYFL